jgi:rhodanese-related sulfurtransferase
MKFTEKFNENKQRWLIVALLFIGILAVPLSFVSQFWGTPHIYPTQAKKMIEAEKEQTVIIDVRSATEFAGRSLNGSLNIPIEQLNANSLRSLEQALKTKQNILVICATGRTGILATKKLQKIGYSQAKNITGGIDAWISEKIGCSGYFCKIRQASGLSTGIITKRFTFIEQFCITFSSFVLKTIYSLLALLLAILIWKVKSEEVSAVKWAMLAFFLGENACSINYLFFNEQSLLFEYYHCLGMMICFGFMTYALTRIVDVPLIRYTPKTEKCSLLPICKACYKYYPIPCTIRHFYMWMIPALMVIAFIPLSAPLHSYYYSGVVFGTDVLFSHTLNQQLLEIRFCPLVALIFYAISWFILLLKKEAGFKDSKTAFAIASGMLGFSLMRFFLFWTFANNPIWADSWEEFSEFIFIAGLLLVFWKLKAIERRSQKHTEPSH